MIESVRDKSCTALLLLLWIDVASARTFRSEWSTVEGVALSPPIFDASADGSKVSAPGKLNNRRMARAYLGTS